MSNHRVVLIGSVPFDSAETTFAEVDERIGPACACVPDGETGPRLNWIGWYYTHLRTNKAFELADSDPKAMMMPPLRLREGLSWDTFNLRPTGYLEAAQQSYATFRDMKRTGKFAPETRFQVSIPTPLMLSTPFVDSSNGVIAAHERALASEIRDFVGAVPAEELALQWDFAGEIVNAELARQEKSFFLGGAQPPSLDEGVAALQRACEAVPDGVELGVHCCFGDPGGKHIVEPLDAALPVQAINGLLASTSRGIDWVHVPVPIGRDDPAYFEPLKQLRGMDRTLLVLGLIHQEDGVEGARRRMAAARSAVSGQYGVATECGLGRIDPQIIPELLDLHKQVSELT